MHTEKILIGRNDLIDFPVYGIKNIKAKIDTGAYTSAIHCTEPKIINGPKKQLSFCIINEKAKETQSKEFIVDEFSERDIKKFFWSD